jgi:Leucine-rich repeat (LRR) protein
MSWLSQVARGKLLLSVFAGLLLSACADYRFSINDKVLYTPDTLFSDYAIVDDGLRACVEQLVSDASITAASQLEEINCSHAGITELQGIEIFSGLTRLKLSSNAITNITPLSELLRLSEIHLDGNQISSLSAVRLLPDLSYINVSGNSQLNCTELANMAREPGLTLVMPKHCLEPAQ